MKIGVLIVSDRAFTRHEYDKSGPEILKWITSTPSISHLFDSHVLQIVPDDKDAIQNQVQTWTLSPSSDVGLILTSGGTGFSIRDITPEAIRPLIEKEATGLSSLILSKSIEITPFAALSRPVCGIRGKTLIITLPGSPKACIENLTIIETVLPHAIRLLRDIDTFSHPVSTLPFQKEDNSGTQSLNELEISRAKFGCTCNETTQFSVSQRPRQSLFEMVPFDDALDTILQLAEKLPPVSLNVTHDINGYVLAETLYSKVDVPPFDSSYVDGYAALHPCPTGKYTVFSRSLAGDETEVHKQNIPHGKVVRVNTGCPVPLNTECIIMVEDTLVSKTSADGEELEIEVLKYGGDVKGNVRSKGSDLKVGQILMLEGSIIRKGGSHLGLLISGGISNVQVYRKPVVGVLSTGNELVDFPQAIEGNKIWDTNRPCLISSLKESGIEVIDLGIVKDNRPELAIKMASSLKSVDILVTTGGVSMGEKDYIKQILKEDINATIHFGRVNLKPGKPTTFATVQMASSTKFIFALPGNPVSAMVTSFLFIHPCIRKLKGDKNYKHEKKMVRLGSDIVLDKGRPEFVRASLETQFLEETNSYVYVALLLGPQTSSRLLGISGADVLLQLPTATEETTVLKKGTFVEGILMG